MEKELKSEGQCLYCNQFFSQKEITKHLDTHLLSANKQDVDKTTASYHHIIIEAGEMFLEILVEGEQKMKIIDDFLRRIWLECCGHLSGFQHKNFKIGMSNKVKEVFDPKVKILHQYDYGSTTTIALRSGKVFELNLKEKLILLSRNEPLEQMCAICKTKPAENICSVCHYEQDAFFCEACSAVHAQTCDDFEDYAKMPVVNSPRMGECGYEGGSIDVERDGAYRTRRG
jgi:CRISPR/Cas system-associated protein Cas10 (large subunit of type III CRISPR-Cas system)